MSEKRLSRTELKHLAQETLMHGIGNQLGYWNPAEHNKSVPKEQLEELGEVMQREADRVARLFGYEKSWRN